jgi:hypothetical protein
MGPCFVAQKYTRPEEDLRPGAMFYLMPYFVQAAWYSAVQILAAESEP